MAVVVRCGPCKVGQHENCVIWIIWRKVRCVCEERDHEG